MPLENANSSGDSGGYKTHPLFDAVRYAPTIPPENAVLMATVRALIKTQVVSANALLEELADMRSEEEPEQYRSGLDMAVTAIKKLNL